MKRIQGILIGVLTCAFLFSCEKETMLTINQAALSFDSSGGNQSVSLVANKVWSASSSQSWCKVSPSSGDGSDNSNFNLSVSCDANTTYDERSCTITITCEELTSTITVTQAEGKGLILSQTEYNLTNEAQSIFVEVQANVQYAVSIADACKSWIKQESTKGLSPNTIKFAISKNEEYDGREGKIIIKQTDGSLSGTVVVKQSQTTGLFAEELPMLSYNSQTIAVDVQANVEFEVISMVDWIHYIETKGLKSYRVFLDVDSNEFIVEREGKVILNQKNGNMSYEIKIKQSGDPVIEFADKYAKIVCVKKFDKNGDGELTYGEASKVTELGSRFFGDYTRVVQSFNELSYFVSLSSIPEECFAGCIALEEVSLPEGIKTIKSRAFYGCPIKKIVFNNNLERIEELSLAALNLSSEYETFNIPSSVHYIGKWGVAFNNYKEIVIPATVEISPGIIAGCDNLQTIHSKYATPDNKNLIVGDILYGFAPAGLTKYVTPPEVKELAHGIF